MVPAIVVPRWVLALIGAFFAVAAVSASILATSIPDPRDLIWSFVGVVVSIISVLVSIIIGILSIYFLLLITRRQEWVQRRDYLREYAEEFNAIQKWRVGDDKNARLNETLGRLRDRLRLVDFDEHDVKRWGNGQALGARVVAIESIRVALGAENQRRLIDQCFYIVADSIEHSLVRTPALDRSAFEQWLALSLASDALSRLWVSEKHRVRLRRIIPVERDRDETRSDEIRTRYDLCEQILKQLAEQHGRDSIPAFWTPLWMRSRQLSKRWRQ